MTYPKVSFDPTDAISAGGPRQARPLGCGVPAVP